MTLKGRLGAFMALSAIMSDPNMYSGDAGITVEPDTEGQKHRAKLAHQEVMKEKGLKWFNIDGKEVLALNYKNAVRKAKKS